MTTQSYAAIAPGPGLIRQFGGTRAMACERQSHACFGWPTANAIYPADMPVAAIRQRQKGKTTPANCVVSLGRRTDLRALLKRGRTRAARQPDDGRRNGMRELAHPRAMLSGSTAVFDDQGWTDMGNTVAIGT